VSLLIIDDLADRPHDCDAVLDQTVVTGSEDRYATLVPDSARRLYGGSYALLRPEFGQALQRRRDQAGKLTDGSILLFLGATDAGALTLPLAEHLRCAFGPERLVVLIGKTNPLRAQLHDWCAAHGVQGLLNVDNMAALLADCRLLVGACGMTAVEAQSIGVPCLLVPLSPIQRSVALQFVSVGRAVILDPADVLERRVVLNEVARAMAIPPDAPTVTAFSANGAWKVAAVLMGEPND
jgi:UDP-2,4-diacetamido-2,4,6-trideoxy-beta-L-altropyranose hydrolase